jgi:ElaB/YqjD/DUF883 family membrane-anchored ribosome-binding protein
MTRTTGDYVDDANAQIARLREQVEALMHDRVQPAVEQARGKVRERADQLSGQVKEAPLVAVVIAAAVGFLLGRASR